MHLMTEVEASTLASVSFLTIARSVKWEEEMRIWQLKTSVINVWFRGNYRMASLLV